MLSVKNQLVLIIAIAQIYVGSAGAATAIVEVDNIEFRQSPDGKMALETHIEEKHLSVGPAQSTRSRGKGISRPSIPTIIIVDIYVITC